MIKRLSTLFVPATLVLSACTTSPAPQEEVTRTKDWDSYSVIQMGEHGAEADVSCYEVEFSDGSEPVGTCSISVWGFETETQCEAETKDFQSAIRLLEAFPDADKWNCEKVPLIENENDDGFKQRPENFDQENAQRFIDPADTI